MSLVNIIQYKAEEVQTDPYNQRGNHGTQAIKN